MNRLNFLSFCEVFTGNVSAESWIGHSFVVIVVDMRVSHDTGVFSSLEVLIRQQVHFL